MARIRTYEIDSNITDADTLIGTDSNDLNKSKNFLLSGIAQFTNSKVNLSTTTDNGTGLVNLSTQTLSILGTANEIETSGENQIVKIGLPDDVTVTNNLTVGGDVGIGTTEPTAKLHVDGNDIADGPDGIKITGMNASTGLKLEGVGGQGGQGSANRAINVNDSFKVSWGGRVEIAGPGSTTPALSVTNGNGYFSNKVGIGTAPNYGYTLDVRGIASFIENVLTVGDIPDSVAYPTPNGSRVRIIGDSSAGANPGLIIIDTKGSGTRGAFLVEGGNVEIGTLSGGENGTLSLVKGGESFIEISNNGKVNLNSNTFIKGHLNIQDADDNAAGQIRSTYGGVSIDATGADDRSIRLAINGDNKLVVHPDGAVTIARIGTDNNKPLLTVNGAVQIGNSFQNQQTAAGGPGGANVDNVGTLRYRDGDNRSYLEMCMKTGINPDVYSWVIIKQNVL